MAYYFRSVEKLALLLCSVCLFAFGPNAFSQQMAVGGGREHTLVLRSDGQVFSFGDNGIGQLGNGTINSTLTNTVDLIAGLTNVVGVAAGGLNVSDSHSIVLKSDGRLWGFG